WRRRGGQCGRVWPFDFGGRRANRGVGRPEDSLAHARGMPLSLPRERLQAKAAAAAARVPALPARRCEEAARHLAGYYSPAPEEIQAGPALPRQLFQERA